MRLHQVITGSRNKGRNCLACLNFSGFFYVIYGRGRNLVILDKDLFQVQVIVDAVRVGNDEINCISCEDLSGLISASDGKTVAIFEPIFSSKIWKKNYEFSPDGFVTALSWFPHASICQSPLLAISSLNKTDYRICVWRISSPSSSAKTDLSIACQRTWVIETTDPVDCLSVSPDGRFIASSASSACQIRVWCRTDFLSGHPVEHFSKGETGDAEDHQMNSAVIWLPCTLRHPEEIVFFAWRSIPRCLPPGWLPNALLTVCSDGVARIWFEASMGAHRHHYLDREGNPTEKGSESNSPTQNSAKKNFLPSVFFNHPVLGYYFRLWAAFPQNQESTLNVPNLQSDLTILPPLDPVKCGKFFTAASINLAKCNLNVLSNLKSTSGEPDKSAYILQWMNEKSKDLELKLSRFLQRVILLVTSVSVGDPVTEHATDRFRSIIGILDQMLLKCLSKWQKSRDTLLMLHPSDGSLFVWVVNGLDSSALNGSMLSSNAHRICDGSVQPGGLSNRVRNNVQLDLTQQQRVCQTFCCLRSRLPDTGSTYVTSLTTHDPILFTRVYESGPETNTPFHILLVKCILLRSKLSQAVESNLAMNIRDRFISEIRKIQIECMSSPNSCGQLMLSMYSAGVNDLGGSIKHQSVGCSAIIHNSDLFDVTSTTSEAVRQANGHSESVILLLHHPLLPLVITLSASELNLWHVPLCSPGPLSAPVSHPLRKFGRYLQPVGDSTKALRSAAFFPCIITPLVYRNMNDKMLQLPISIIAVESTSEVRLFCVDTTGDVLELETLPEVSMAPTSTSVLFVIPAPIFLLGSSTSTFLIVRVLSIRKNVGLNVCRTEIWRVDLNPDRLTNGQSSGFEALLIRQRSSASIVASITKISDEILPMEPGVSVECVKCGPLQISCSNEALQPSYLLATACSDGEVRFWTLEADSSSGGISSGVATRWIEWQHAYSELTSTRIRIPLDLLKKRLLDAELDDVSRNQVSLSPLHRSSTFDNLRFQSARVITVACSTNWRVAIGCIADHSDPIMIAIYECESTGGSEWMLEDIVIPSMDLRPSTLTPAELQSIQLDWVKTEDGRSNLLSFVCGQTLYVSAARCMDTIRMARDLRSGKSNALLDTMGEVGLRWCHLRLVSLQADDSKSPVFPLVWLPSGILMFHHNSHIYLFSQWSSNHYASNRSPSTFTRPFKEDVDSGVVSVEAARLKAIYSNLHLTKLLTKQELQSKSYLKKFQENPNHFTESFYDNLGLFEAARLLNPTLPQFHPRQLLEWMNLGRFRLIQATLVHLTRCLYSLDYVFGGSSSSKKQLEQSVSKFLNEEDTKKIPPPNPTFLDVEVSSLPLYVMTALDSLKFEFDDQLNGPKDENLNMELEDLLNQGISTYLQNDSDLLDQEDNATSQMEDWEASLEKLGYLSNGTPSSPLWDPKDQKALSSLLKFGTFEGEILSSLLRRYRLLGLSQLDQIYLQGIVELLSSTQMEVTERLSGLQIKVRPSLSTFQGSCDSGLFLDDCGLRFAMIMQLYNYLCETLPPEKQAKMLEDGLTSRSFVWAFHSEAEEVLLSFLPSQKAQREQSQFLAKPESDLTWEEFRRFGCAWWIHSDTLLLQCAEKMARSAFMANNDPMSAAIFYLAMNKPTVLASLYRNQGNRPLENFFRSDFSRGAPACKQAKMNAFRLLSQHKHVEAAALFLLGGWLEDAIRVCVHTVKDLQLAVFVCRLFSLSHVDKIGGEASTYHNILRSCVICHGDPYLRSIGYWVLSEPLNALTTLLMKPSEKPEDNALSLLAPSPSMTRFPRGFEVEICPSVFRLYIYLRHHPLVLRNLRLLDGSEGFSQLQNRLALLDRRLYFRTAYHYNTIGCPALALEVLQKLPRIRLSNTHVNNQMTNLKQDLNTKPQLDATSAEEEVKFSFFDAALDVRKYLDTSEFKITLSDDENEETPADLVANGNIDENFHVASSDIGSLGEDLVVDNVVTAGGTKIQYQMKYWACLRIFTDELCSNLLTVSFEGSCLKRFLYTWLENEISQLEMLALPTDTTSFAEESSDIDQQRYSCYLPCGSADIDKSLLFPINYAEPRHSEGFVMASLGEQKSLLTGTDESDGDLCLRLATNFEFMRSLIAFCCLHGESGVNLRIVRMELTHLLMDLFSSISERTDYSGRGHLLYSLPLLRKSQINAPLRFTGHIDRPLDLIKTLINDINSCILEMPPPYMRFVRRLPLSTFSSTKEQPSEEGSAKELEATVREVALLRNLCMALSACVFQSLSIANWRTMKLQGDAGLAVAVGQSNTLTAERFAKLQKPLLPNSEPSDWPGVLGLFTAFENDSSSSASPQAVLLGVLAEALVAVYMGLCVCALYTRDSSVLYRLASNASLGDASTWGRVFGGVCRLKPERPPPPPSTAVAMARRPSPSPSPPPRPKLSPVASTSQHLMASGSSLQVVSSTDQAPNRTPMKSPTITHADELFLPPQCSMVMCFLEKPFYFGKSPADQDFDYDSDDSSLPISYDSYSDGVAQLLRRSRPSRTTGVPVISSTKPKVTGSADLQEGIPSQPAQSTVIHPGCDLKVVRLDPDLGEIELDDTVGDSTLGEDEEIPLRSGQNDSLSAADREWFEGDSFSWRLMRLAFIQLMQQQLDALIQLLNLENEFLASYAPTLLQARSLLENWVTGYREALEVESGTEDAIAIRVIAAEYVPETTVGLHLGQDQFSASETNLTESARRSASKMEHITKPGNSPFRSRNPLSLPVKRLWFCLLNHPGLGETFMRWIFHPKKLKPLSLQPIKLEVASSSAQSAILPSSQPDKKIGLHPDQKLKVATNTKENELPVDGAEYPDSSGSTQHQCSVNLVHRELEPLLCMCVDKFSYECVALATSKQLIEVSISNLLSPADWLFDDFEYDLEVMRNPLKSRRSRSVNDFLLYEKEALDLVDHSHEQFETSSPNIRGINSHLFRGLINAPSDYLSEHILEFSQRLAPTILRRNVSGVQKLSSHPLLSFYLCGTASGSVHVLEWRSEMPVVSMLANTFSLTPQGHGTPISSTIRGNPVSVLHLDLFGKRFGCGDTAGYFGLWNIDFTGSHCYPYFSCRCHLKGVLDFAFLDGGSTKLATAGAGGVPTFAASSGNTTVSNAISAANRPGQRITTQVELETANVVIWDSMEPQKSAAVMTFAEAPLDAACTCVTSIPSGSFGYQLAVGTKRGEVAILDLRKRPAVTAFNHTAHEGSALRSIICDSATDTLTTAGADGLAKVWRLSDPCHLLTTFRSDASGSHGGNKAAAAAAALFRGNQSAAVAVASRPGISQLVSLPSTSTATEYRSGEIRENLHLLTTRFLACGVNGCLQMCSVAPSPEPIWLRRAY